MDFRITLTSGQVVEHTGSYHLPGSGILTLTDNDGGRVRYSPAGWVSIEYLQPRRPAVEDEDGTSALS